MGKIIEIKNLNYEYGDLAFESFNMSINEGDIVSLIGPSLSGKTTLLKMLCHKLPNEWCYFKGNSFKDISVNTLKREIVVVLDTKLNEYSVKLELLHYISQLDFSEKVIDEKYNKIITYFGLEMIENKPILELSYRDKVLIRILSYLIIEPSFLAIDCVFSLLSNTNKKRLIEYIKENKITLLNVINDLNDTLLGNKIYIIDNHELIMNGSTTSILKADTVLKRLGFSLPLATDLSIQLVNYEILKKIYNDSDKLVGALWK